VLSVSRRRLVLAVLLAFLLGAVASPGGTALVRTVQGDDPNTVLRVRAIEVASRIDDQRVIAFADLADQAAASSDRAWFLAAASVGKAYLDSVLPMQATLGRSGAEPMPEWFYDCFNTTTPVTRSSALVFEAEGGVAVWAPDQAALVQRTVADLRTVSDLVDMIANGGQLVAPTSSVRPGPNGVFSSEAACRLIQSLADSMSQRVWPG